MFFFDMRNTVAAREDRKPKYWRLGRRHLGFSLMLWRHTVKHDILNMVCDCWFPCYCVYWCLVKARKIVWKPQVIDSSSITQPEAIWVWRCDVTTSHWIQDGGALVVNILVFDLRVQLQHCTYQRKTLLFALIKVSTFICKREISGLSSPLTNWHCQNLKKIEQNPRIENSVFCTKFMEIPSWRKGFFKLRGFCFSHQIYIFVISNCLTFLTENLRYVAVKFGAY